jgi:hypothetical protein
MTSPRAAWYEPPDDPVDEAAGAATCPRCGRGAAERDFDGCRLTLACAACGQVWFESLREHRDDRGDRLFHEQYEDGALPTFRSRGAIRQ